MRFSLFVRLVISGSRNCGVVLIGLTRGVFSSRDRLCCVGGLPQSNQFDSITVVDIEREFETVFTTKTNMLPSSVKLK